MILNSAEFSDFKCSRNTDFSESYLEAILRDLDNDYNNDILKQKVNEQITAHLNSNTFSEIKSTYFSFWPDLDSLLQRFGTRGEDYT